MLRPKSQTLEECRKLTSKEVSKDNGKNNIANKVLSYSTHFLSIDYTPSRQSLPFLPRTAKCLKPGHLAKVIAKNGRVVVGRVRYVGPIATVDKDGSAVIDDLYVGVQLQSKCGDCDGTFEGRKFFDW